MRNTNGQKSCTALQPYKPSLLKFIGALIQDDLKNTCRRQYCRHSIRVTLTIQPLTEDFLPDGEGFSAISNDVSLKGMAFVSHDAIEHDFVRVSFPQFEISVIAKVRHNTSIGIDYPLFLVGAEFLDEYYQA